MSDETRPPGSSDGRRKRPPAVIDVQATEILPDPPPSPPAGEASPQSAAEETVAEQTAEPPVPPMEPPSDAPASSEAPQPEPASRSSRSASALPWSHAAAGLVGGAVVLLLLWLAGLLPWGGGSPDDSRLAGIERQLNELSSRPVPTADPKAAQDIAARITKIETALATPQLQTTDPGVLDRITALEKTGKSTADNVAALARRADTAGATLRDIDGKLGRMSGTLAEVQTAVKDAAAGSDRASRLAVAASALRGAVERGDPFTAEIAIVKPLSPDADAVATLEPFAASGVPGDAALGRELAALVQPMLKVANEAPQSAGFLDRLQANAEKLVRIRPVGDEAKGDDRGAILSRIEQRAAQGNVTDAVAELNKLPAEARAPFQPWIAKVAARDKALAASRTLSADSVAALKAAP